MLKPDSLICTISKLISNHTFSKVVLKKQSFFLYSLTYVLIILYHRENRENKIVDGNYLFLCLFAFSYFIWL
jgi:hypothetical protein